MKNKIYGVSLFALLVAITCLAFVACGSSVAVTMSKESASIAVGDSVTLAVYEDGEYVVSGITWASSDTSIATVASGKVTGVKAGTATITATSENGSVTCAVTVTDSAELSESEVTVPKGKESFTITYLLNGSEVSTGVTWASSNSSCVTVSSAGYVEGIAVGEATITGTYNDISATCKVIVAENVTYLDATSAYTNVNSSTTIGLYEDSDEITAGVVWDTADSSVATVSAGVISGVGAGNTTVTATYGGVTYTCAVTVYAEGAVPFTLTQETVANGGTSIGYEAGVLYTCDLQSSSTLTLVDGVITIDRAAAYDASAQMIRYIPVDASGEAGVGSCTMNFDVTNKTDATLTAAINLNGTSTTTYTVDSGATESKTYTCTLDGATHINIFRFTQCGAGIITVSNIVFSFS